MGSFGGMSPAEASRMRGLIVVCWFAIGCTSAHREDAPADADVPLPDPDPERLGRIECGTLECDATTQGCLASCLYATDERMPACVALSDDGRWPAAECPTGRERFPRYWLTCDGAEDCAAGELCHVVYGSAGQYASCATCDGSCDLRFFRSLCRSDADCPSLAPLCIPNADLPGYSTCEPG